MNFPDDVEVAVRQINVEGKRAGKNRIKRINSLENLVAFRNRAGQPLAWRVLPEPGDIPTVSQPIRHIRYIDHSWMRGGSAR